MFPWVPPRNNWVRDLAQAKGKKKVHHCLRQMGSCQMLWFCDNFKFPFVALPPLRLLNQLLENTEEMPYSFHLEETEITSNLAASFGKLASQSTESWQTKDFQGLLHNLPVQHFGHKQSIVISWRILGW